jgi:hypothetical protein
VPARKIFLSRKDAEAYARRMTSRWLEPRIDVAERLPVAVLDDEASVEFFDSPGWRESDEGRACSPLILHCPVSDVHDFLGD